VQHSLTLKLGEKNVFGFVGKISRVILSEMDYENVVPFRSSRAISLPEAPKV